MSRTKKCLVCDDLINRKPSQAGKYCSRKCYAKQNAGKNHRNWKGGKENWNITIHDLNNLPEKLIKNFHSKYKKTQSCWLWDGMINHDGYGLFNISRPSYMAHRIMWTIVKGKIPDGLNVLHRCDVRNCVNPKHLFLGSQLDNIIDRDTKGRMRRNKRGQYAEMCVT